MAVVRGCPQVEGHSVFLCSAAKFLLLNAFFVLHKSPRQQLLQNIPEVRHMPSLTRTHAHTCKQLCMYTHTHMHARTHARTHIRTHARTHTHTHSFSQPPFCVPVDSPALWLASGAPGGCCEGALLSAPHQRTLRHQRESTCPADRCATSPPPLPLPSPPLPSPRTIVATSPRR